MSFTSFFHLLWNGCFFDDSNHQKVPLLHNFKKCEMYFDKQKITLDIASTKTEQELGLSYRKNIGKYEGMLFKPIQDSPTTFHTQKLLFDICVVFLNDKNIVISSQILRQNDTTIAPNTTFSVLELPSLYCSNIKKEQYISLCEGE